MRANKWTSIIAAMVFIAVLIFTGCDSIKSIKSMAGSEAEILESAYFYDEDTGAYRTVLTIQNNTLNPIKMGFVKAKAYDENGERIDPVKDEHGNYELLTTYSWLGTGEKTAVIKTNDGFAGNEDVEFSSILDHYTAVPATLEWEAESGARQDPNLLPHGLSVTEVDSPYYSQCTATIHNDSEIDYTSDEGSFEFTGDGKRFEFVIVAVYRDDEGKICDAQELNYSHPGYKIPAGGDAQLGFYANHTVSDESLTPEYYISITDLTYEADE